MDSSYLARTESVLQAAALDLPALQAPAEAAAERLAAGGGLWVGGHRGLAGELLGRAGGFMMLRPAGKVELGVNDVLLHGAVPGEALPGPVPGRPGLVITFGEAATGSAPGPVLPHRADAGALSPAVAVTILGWAFTGELIAALTRRGRMPVIYESVGAYGGWPRMDTYRRGEIAFHENTPVPPVPPGQLARQYLDAVAAMLRRIECEQRPVLNRVGGWLRDARAAGRAPLLYSMGHLVPREMTESAIGRTFRTGAWNAGFRNQTFPNDPLQAGDVAIHVGYQHPPEELLQRARAAGARAAYVCLRQARDFAGAPDIAWVDPMWDWADACVPLPGYDVPLLPASGVINSAIAWELLRLALAPGEDAP